MVALVVMIQAWSGQARAGDEVSMAGSAAESEASDLVASPDSHISREDWKRRIGEARSRAEQARREWRLNAPLRTFVPDPPEKIATERVLSNDTLQPGDIVSTDKGFFVFRGRSGTDGQAADFVPIAPR
ncbi:hypothetical protein [Bradyrhizobium sp. CB2312]|uniref:hypothetical protein n=1 Tax=Bradyrhizobium sp. CB2312 TaxID=3039155 RepID=UPI0024B1D7DE|nr:hypothetical protein [Bradyrhizobium sp. CB2312]WFU70990.1 hypothetical protein QA642_37900 [Bradyrhizobium sp. CB2312]